MSYNVKNYICKDCYKKIGECTCGGNMMYVPAEIQNLYVFFRKKGYNIRTCAYNSCFKVEFELSYFNKTDFLELPEEFVYDYKTKTLKSRVWCNDKQIEKLFQWCEQRIESYEPVAYGPDLIKGNYNGTYVKKEFGEHLVMFQLMTYKGWDVENVDYVGVDLIAIDPVGGAQYAIQVKLRQFNTDSNGKPESEVNSNFTFDSEMKLRRFAKEMSLNGKKMIPLVAYVNINLDQSLNTILINLDDLVQMRQDDEKNGISYYSKKKGYGCNTGAQLNRLIAEGKATCYRYIPSFYDTCVDGPSMEMLPIKDDKYQNYLQELEQKNRKERKTEEDDKDVTEKERDTLIGHDKVQKGTFGEWYCVFKSLVNGEHPFLIQSEGIDILRLRNAESENERKLVAVSVKTFSKKKQDFYVFEADNVKKMTAFCDKWGIAKEDRIVTLQFLIYRNKKQNGELVYNNVGQPVKEYYKMYCFEMTLDYFVNTANKNHELKHINLNPHIVSVVDDSGFITKGYKINWSGDNLEKIINDENIKFKVVILDEVIAAEETKRR